VLDGVFQDEHGDYPAGSYVRNAPGTSHAPCSDVGCVILVKLWQFDPNDRHSLALRADELGAQHSSLVSLFRDAREEVRIELWSANAPLAHLDAKRGLELRARDDHSVDMRSGSWQHSAHAACVFGRTR
jgi:hypothetical protein